MVKHSMLWPSCFVVSVLPAPDSPLISTVLGLDPISSFNSCLPVLQYHTRCSTELHTLSLLLRFVAITNPTIRSIRRAEHVRPARLVKTSQASKQIGTSTPNHTHMLASNQAWHFVDGLVVMKLFNTCSNIAGEERAPAFPNGLLIVETGNDFEWIQSLASGMLRHESKMKHATWKTKFSFHWASHDEDRSCECVNFVYVEPVPAG